MPRRCKYKRYSRKGRYIRPRRQDPPRVIDPALVPMYRDYIYLNPQYQQNFPDPGPPPEGTSPPPPTPPQIEIPTVPSLEDPEFPDDISPDPVPDDPLPEGTCVQDLRHDYNQLLAYARQIEINYEELKTNYDDLHAEFIITDRELDEYHQQVDGQIQQLNSDLSLANDKLTTYEKRLIPQLQRDLTTAQSQVLARDKEIQRIGGQLDECQKKNHQLGQDNTGLQKTIAYYRSQPTCSWVIISTYLRDSTTSETFHLEPDAFHSSYFISRYLESSNGLPFYCLPEVLQLRPEAIYFVLIDTPTYIGMALFQGQTLNLFITDTTESLLNSYQVILPTRNGPTTTMSESAIFIQPIFTGYGSLPEHYIADYQGTVDLAINFYPSELAEISPTDRPEDFPPPLQTDFLTSQSIVTIKPTHVVTTAPFPSIVVPPFLIYHKNLFNFPHFDTF